MFLQAKIGMAALLALLACVVQAVEVTQAWARPTAPGAKVGGAFLTLHGGKMADRLTGASSPNAVAVELHTHVMTAGVASMRAVPAIDVQAGERVDLRPGGLHLMLINLKSPLKSGETVPIKLRFEKAGEIEIRALIASEAPGSKEESHGHQHGHH